VRYGKNMSTSLRSEDMAPEFWAVTEH
jgi:hypothetical protein